MAKTVLIIENDPDTLEVLEHVVTELNVKTISKRATISLGELEKLNPSLVLLDHWLDEGYGADYCKLIKANDGTRHIPVIILSFITQLKTISEDSNADDYVAKPFEIEKLQEVVYRYLS